MPAVGYVSTQHVTVRDLDVLELSEGSYFELVSRSESEGGHFVSRS